jgi:hypothetical protein
MRRPLNERKRLLSLNICERPNYVQLSSITIIDFRPSSWLASLESFRHLYLECLDRCEEGLIIKNADSFYLPGDRRNWWKLKKDYIEGFGDTADFSVVAAFKTRKSGGLLDEFIVACLTNKTDVENDPMCTPNFQAIFTVSLGLTKSEFDLLQAIIEARKEPDPSNLCYDCQFSRGFYPKETVDVWLREPLVFELLGSGLIRERGMWCYSLRFPRIKSVKLSRTFMDCVSFQELQDMGKNYISTDNADVEAISGMKPKKRVRFEIDMAEQPMKYLKNGFFFYLSKRLSLKDREKLSSWLDSRGFELIWSIEAALAYSDRHILVISTGVDEDFSEFDSSSKIKHILVIDGNAEQQIENLIRVEGLYFWLTRA